MMNKRRGILGATLAILILALLGLGWAVLGKHQVSMAQAEIQSKIDAQMPNTQKGVTISNVKLDLADNKINLTLDATASAMGVECRMTGATRGTLRYDSSEGSFYFHPESLDIKDFKAAGANVSDKVSGLIDKLDRKKDKDDDPKSGLMDKVKDTARDLAQKGAENAFERMPIYTLQQDFKGSVVKAVLTDVEIKDRKVIAHLTLVQFTTIAAILALLIVAAIVFVITRLRK
jgi:hypothetical protein